MEEMFQIQSLCLEKCSNLKCFYIYISLPEHCTTKCKQILFVQKEIEVQSGILEISFCVTSCIEYGTAGNVISKKSN